MNLTLARQIDGGCEAVSYYISVIISPSDCHTVHVVTDARHEKTDLKVFVAVIPKEGWACVAVPILLLE